MAIIASDHLISLFCASGVGKSIVGRSFLLREGFQLGSDAALGFYHGQESYLVGFKTGICDVLSHDTDTSGLRQQSTLLMVQVVQLKRQTAPFTRSQMVRGMV